MTKGAAGRWRWRNVPIPEPHVGGLGAGVVLHALRPWPLPIGDPVRWGVGGTLLLAGVGLVVWAVQSVGDRDIESASGLVTAGPYRHSRNPMYVGWTGLYLSITLLAGVTWPLAMVPVVALAVHRTVRREERRLERSFGDEYRTYRRRVRRYGW